VNIIDGFAGPGEYIGGKDGSPVIAVKAVIDHTIKIRSNVTFIFIEKDERRCEFLKNKLAGLKVPSNVEYECICGEFLDVTSQILEETGKSGKVLAPTFVFIDPFGFTGIPFDLVKKFMLNPRCEVLVNFMFEEINRFVNLPENETNYNNLFGNLDWQEAMKSTNPRERLEILHDAYKKQLKTIAKYVVSFRMTNKYNKAEYFLFFATNHLLGLKKMKESMWKVDPKGDFEFSDATYSPTQTVLFELQPNFAYLRKLILQRFRTLTVTIEELEEWVVTETAFRETHVKRQILQQMEQSGELEVIAKERRKAGTYPPGTSIHFL